MSVVTSGRSALAAFCEVSNRLVKALTWMLGRKFDETVKTVVVGDSGVGKTSTLFRFVRDVFEEDQTPTLGVEFMSKIITREKRRIELQLWDTAGQELFRSVTRGYYRGSIGAFIVYDITNRLSFENVERWLQDLKNTAREDVVIVLIGNKSDLSSHREVSTEDASSFASERNLLFFETSAKTGENVERAMLACLDRIEDMIDKGLYTSQIGSESGVAKISPESQSRNPEEKSGGCC